MFGRAYFVREKFAIKPRPVVVDLVFRAEIQAFCLLRCLLGSRHVSSAPGGNVALRLKKNPKATV